MKCKIHPEYTGQFKPWNECLYCWRHFDSFHFELNIKEGFLFDRTNRDDLRSFLNFKEKRDSINDLFYYECEMIQYYVNGFYEKTHDIKIYRNTKHVFETFYPIVSIKHAPKLLFEVGRNYRVLDIEKNIFDSALILLLDIEESKRNKNEYLLKFLSGGKTLSFCYSNIEHFNENLFSYLNPL